MHSTDRISELQSQQTMYWKIFLVQFMNLGDVSSRILFSVETIKWELACWAVLVMPHLYNKTRTTGGRRIRNSRRSCYSCKDSISYISFISKDFWAFSLFNPEVHPWHLGVHQIQLWSILVPVADISVSIGGHIGSKG